VTQRKYNPKTTNQHTQAPWPARFWAKVEKNGPIFRPELGPCWLWLGTIIRGGYGMVRDPENHKMVPAHRAAFEIEKGKLAKEFDCCHKCDNPPCVRPSHLFAGTEFDNLRDAVTKERARRKLNWTKVRIIRWLKELGLPQRKIAPIFGSDQSMISRVATRRCWQRDPREVEA
jgi:predicted XRE-type DNA-binding protein